MQIAQCAGSLRAWPGAGVTAFLTFRFTLCNEAITGQHKPFFLIVQEKKEDYDVLIYDMSAWLELGRVKYMKAIENIKKYQAGNLKGYSDILNEHDFAYESTPPIWELRKFDLD